MVRAAGGGDLLGHLQADERLSLVTAIGIFALAFLVLGWPWFSGAVTIPWDGKSSFYTQLVFLARSLAEGQSPFWQPYMYAGWPQIADPQSLIFSPFHLLLALIDPSPSFRAADGVAFALLFVGGVGVILIFHERKWHLAGAVVAAIAFAWGGSSASRIQHIGQIESLAFLPPALWLLMRALDRSSWRLGFGAGAASAVIVLGRDQVSLIALYVLLGYVLWHWLEGAGRLARFKASIKPLAGGMVAGLLIITVPVVFSALLAAGSNRPEIGLEFAGRGSLHPAHLLMLAFADVYGASDPHIEFWGPPSFAWHKRFGDIDLYVAQNMGQIYAGALVVVALLSLGVVRGVAWTREIRFFTVASILLLLYALGRYTPAFSVMYELLPGVTLFRRPADATFVFGATIAILAGYLVHRWITGTVPAPRPWQRALEVVIAVAFVVGSLALAWTVNVLHDAAIPVLIGTAYTVVACAALYLARRMALYGAIAPAVLLAVFSTTDLRFNNAPNESTGLPPSYFEAMEPDTKNETVTLLKARLAAAAAPDRRDRVELVGIAYHWPNIGAIHGFDHLLGHNPLRLADFQSSTGAMDTIAGPDQRQFTRLLPSYTSPLESLFGVRFVASSVPIENVDKTLKPGDLVFITRTKNAYVYENPRALPRVMLLTDWRLADFAQMIREGGWPVDPRRTVLLEKNPDLAPSDAGGTARILRYRNAEVDIEVEAPAGGGILVLNDIWHPWWDASVDGVPTGILKANVLFRAVKVPPGNHVVHFEFHPFAGALAELKDKISALAP
jgi:hypothetical protein